MLIGKTIDEPRLNIGELWFDFDHSQLRWLGPEKVVHMAVAAIFNSLWDLIAKKNQKPLWKFIVDGERTIMKWLTFKYIEDVLTKDEAFNILQNIEYTKKKEYKPF